MPRITTVRWTLGHGAAQTPICGTKHESLLADIAGTPQANTGRINLWAALKIRDCATPVCNVLRWIDVSAVRPEIAMIVNKHDETGRGECLSETLKTVFLGPRKAVGHGDSGVETIPIGQE
jgi:hypothetical protein